MRAVWTTCLIIANLVIAIAPSQASNCSFDQMVAKDTPAVWFNFDGSGVPTNLGTASTTVKLVGDEPGYNEKTRCGSSYQFRAQGGRVSIQGTGSGSVSDGDFTIETIVKILRQNSVVYPTIFNFNSPGWGTLRVRTGDSNAGKIEYAIFNPGEQGFYSPGIIDDNQYHHLVIVHKAGRVRFFIDGVLNYERAMSAPFNFDDSLDFIGGSSSGNETFPGSMDHFALYANSLSDAVVALHFQAYLKDFYDSQSTPTTSVSSNSNSQIAPPTSPPSGFNLSSFASGITASWASTPEETNTVKVELTCSSSGIKTMNVAARQLETSFQGLQAGEVCSGQIYAQNIGGMSPPSARISNITVRGIAPILPPLAAASLSSNNVVVAVSNIDQNATEVSVELICTKSGNRTIATTPKSPSINFGIIAPGDLCYAVATSKNLWGSAPRGSNSNSVSLYGEKPDAINFTPQSSIAGELKLTWPAQTSSDVTVSASLVCKISNKTTQEVAVSQLQINFSGLTPGDTCAATVIAKNTWGTSSAITKESLLVMGKPPVGEPVVKMARAKLTAMALAWDAIDSATYMNIRVFCTSSGNRTLNVELPTTETEISGKDGESCYTIMRWANAWGFAAETLNTPLLKLSAKAPTPVVTSKKILCIKGKSSLTIVGKNPICPSGYKKKASS